MPLLGAYDLTRGRAPHRAIHLDLEDHAVSSEPPAGLAAKHAYLAIRGSCTTAQPHPAIRVGFLSLMKP